MTDPNQTPRDTDEQVIARVRELDTKATKGPWAVDWGRVRDDNCGTICRHPIEDAYDGPRWVGNKDFIAESRTLLPDLASRLTSALERERALRVAIENAPHADSCRTEQELQEYSFTKEENCDCWKSAAFAKKPRK